jgi:hypothetical protein
MKIRYIFGPRAGEVEHVDRTAAKPLLLAQIAEAVDPEDLKDPNEGVVRAANETYRLPRAGDARPPQSQWSVLVVDDVYNNAYLAIRRQLNWGLTKKVELCFLPPDQVHDCQYHDGQRYCSAFGMPVPPDTLSEYTRRWKQNKQQRAPYKSEETRNRPDVKLDRAIIEKSVEYSTATGVLEGADLIRRPGPRT